MWLHCRQAPLGPSWWWGLAQGAGTPGSLQQASSLRRAHVGLAPLSPLPPTLLHTQSKGAFLAHPFRRLPLRGPGLAPNYNVLFIFQSDKKGAVFQTAMKRPKCQLWRSSELCTAAGAACGGHTALPPAPLLGGPGHLGDRGLGAPEGMRPVLGGFGWFSIPESLSSLS